MENILRNLAYAWGVAESFLENKAVTKKQVRKFMREAWAVHTLPHEKFKEACQEIARKF